MSSNRALPHSKSTSTNSKFWKTLPDIFSIPLEYSTALSKYDDGIAVSRVIRDCVCFIEYNGIEEEGIYRRSGGTVKMETIKKQYNNHSEIDLRQYDIYTVASLLKMYLRELTDDIITSEVKLELDKHIKQITLEEKLCSDVTLNLFKEIVQKLPRCNYETLGWLCVHFKRVADEPKNLMNMHNLAIVLVPTLRFSKNILSTLVEYSPYIFPDIKLNRPLCKYLSPHKLSLEIDKHECDLAKKYKKIDQNKAQEKDYTKVNNILKQMENFKSRMKQIKNMKSKYSALDKPTKKKPSSVTEIGTGGDQSHTETVALEEAMKIISHLKNDQTLVGSSEPKNDHDLEPAPSNNENAFTESQPEIPIMRGSRIEDSTKVQRTINKSPSLSDITKDDHSSLTLCVAKYRNKERAQGSDSRVRRSARISNSCNVENDNDHLDGPKYSNYCTSEIHNSFEQLEFSLEKTPQPSNTPNTVRPDSNCWKQIEDCDSIHKQVKTVLEKDFSVYTNLIQENKKLFFNIEKLNKFLTFETDNIQKIRNKIEKQLHLTGDVFQYFAKEGINADNQDHILQLDEQRKQSSTDDLDPRVSEAIDTNHQLQEKCAQLSTQYFKCLEELIDNNIQIKQLTTTNKFYAQETDNYEDL